MSATPAIYRCRCSVAKRRDSCDEERLTVRCVSATATTAVPAAASARHSLCLRSGAAPPTRLRRASCTCERAAAVTGVKTERRRCRRCRRHHRYCHFERGAVVATAAYCRAASTGHRRSSPAALPPPPRRSRQPRHHQRRPLPPRQPSLKRLLRKSRRPPPPPPPPPPLPLPPAEAASQALPVCVVAAAGWGRRDCRLAASTSSESRRRCRRAARPARP